MDDRDPRAQLTTANWLIAEFRRQILDHEQTGAHADRIDTLREGLATWEARAKALNDQLEPAAAPTVEDGPMSDRSCYVAGCTKYAGWLIWSDEDQGELEACAEHAELPDWPTRQAEADALRERHAARSHDQANVGSAPEDEATWPEPDAGEPTAAS